MSDYTDTYEGPENSPLYRLEQLLEEAGDASEDEISARFHEAADEDDDGEDDMTGATDAFEGEGL